MTLNIIKTQPKLFGFQGEIKYPGVKALEEQWNHDNISFFIKSGIFKAEFASEQEQVKALKLANLYINAWSYRHNIKLIVDFNHFWKPNKDNSTFHMIGIQDSAKASERVITHTLTFNVRACIVKTTDSASFVDCKHAVEKCNQNSTLQKAIEFYYAEALDDNEFSLYGIYKAIEVIIKGLNACKYGGREALAQLAGVSKSYIDDLMQTANYSRHANPISRKKLNNQECRVRAKKLIDAYLVSIK